MRLPMESRCPAETTPETPALDPFAGALARSGVELRRGDTTTLQVNVGFLCNQSCRHCHLSAGPGRTEVMSRETMDAVEAFAKRVGFSVIDITGGAPELVPGIEGFLERLSPLSPRILFRANLTALAGRTALVELLARLRVVIVASFPSLNASQTDTQRGEGVFEKSIGTLRTLNAAGYGREGSGLELDLVSNPAGAFLPPGQAPTEARFHRELARTWGIAFNHLYTFANMPLGRFRDWLDFVGQSGRVPSEARRGLQPLHRQRADVPKPGLRVVGRRTLRLRFQPRLRPPAGRSPQAHLLR